MPDVPGGPPGGVKGGRTGREPLDLAEVARRHGPAILRRCRAILRDATEAEDALQEVYVTLIRKGASFRGDAELSSFLYRVSTNHCLNRLRARRRRTAREGAEPVVAWMDQAPVDPYARYRATARLEEALAKMDPLEQQIFIYRALDGLTLDEIADVTGRARKTIARRLLRLEPILRELFEDSP